MIAQLLLYAYFALVWGQFAANLVTDVPAKTRWRYLMLGMGCDSAHDILQHRSTFNVCFDAAVFAWCAYMWWKSGGGDDTKRRLRKLKKLFEPTRRTAPVMA